MRTNKKPLLLALLLAAMLVGGLLFFLGGDDANVAQRAAGVDAHADKKNEDDHAHGEEESHASATHISDESAQAMGIATMVAGPASIRETVRLSGRIVLNKNRSAEVKARFPGVVRGVFKQVGDTVKRGEKLATVESNESLQVYSVPAPLDGVVLELNVSVGDTAGDAPIFVVADLASLWAEFFVFAGDIEKIRQGQAILLRSLDGKAAATSNLRTIQPTAEVSSQTVVARAEIDNSSGSWRSGMTVQGYVVINESPVALAVPSAAIQLIEGKEVVFVKRGTQYSAVPVTVGRTDAELTEITAGLDAGAEIVSKGSFVVKADIGKAGAEHEH